MGCNLFLEKKMLPSAVMPLHGTDLKCPKWCFYDNKVYTLELERWLVKILAVLAENPHGLDSGEMAGMGWEGRQKACPTHFF